MSDYTRFVVENNEPVTLNEAGSVFTNPETYEGSGAAGQVNAYGNLTVTSADAEQPIVFAQNTANGDGGAIYSAAQSKAALTNVTFSGNTAAGADKKGGAIYISQAGIYTLNNVTFSGNTAAEGGAIYNQVGTIELTGKVYLSTASDTIVNDNGVVNWKLVEETTGASTGYLSDYSLLTNINGGTLTLTVASDQKADGTYVIAGNAASATDSTKNTFLIGIGKYDTSIVVNDTQATEYNGLQYKLSINSNDELVIRTYKIYVRTDGTITGTKDLVPGEKYLNPSTYDGNGGAFDLTDGSTLNSIGTKEDPEAGTKDAPITITENVSTQDGGAIYNDNGTANFANTDLTKNEGVNGGAFYNNGGDLNIGDDTTFTGNKATQDGGAVNNDGGDVTITGDGIALTGNTAGEDGGAINSANGTLDIDGATISGNTAGEDGGAINSANGTLDIDGATISGNTAGANGGAINNDGGDMDIDGATISNNKADANGGAIYTTGGDTAIDGANFEGNTADANGGAIYNNGGTLDIADTTFNGNTATEDGGAIFNTGDGTVNLSNVTFDGNSADQGGAIYNDDGIVNIKGNVDLKTPTDTIYNGSEGTINWNLADPATAGDATLSDYSLLANDGDLSITVSADTYKNSPYTLAENAASAVDDPTKNTFTVTGIQGLDNIELTVNGDAKTYGDDSYALAVDDNNDLVLTVTALEAQITLTPSANLVENGGYGWLKQGDDLSIGIATQYAIADTQKYTLSTDGADPVEATFANPATIDVDTTAEHTYVYTFESENKAGVNEQQVLKIGVDGSGPAAETTLAADSLYTDGDGMNWLRKGDASATITAAITDSMAGVDAAKTTYDGAAYTAGTAVSIDTSAAAAPATHEFFAQDNVGNTSTQQISFGIDGTGPEVSAVSITGDSIYTDAATGTTWIQKDTDAYLNATITDSESGLAKATYNNAAYDGEKFQLATDAEYSHAGYIVADDNVGNTTQSGPVAIGVDGTGPAIGDAAISGDNVYEGWIKQGTTAYAVTEITDDKSGLKSAELNGAAYADGKFLLDTASAAAKTTFAIDAIDNVGNTSAQDIIYGVDGTGPAIDKIALKGENISDKWIKQGSVAYATAVMADGESGFKSASLNGAEFVDGQALLDTAAEAAVIDFSIVALDNVGNSSTATVSYGVDGTGPEIGATTLSGTNISGEWIKQGSTAYAVTDIDDAKSGLKSAELNGTAYADGKFLLDTAAETAIVSYDITAEDKVGNSSSAAVQYGVDGTGPEIGDATISGDNVYGNWIKQGTTAYAVTDIDDAKSGLKSAELNGAVYADGKFLLDTASAAAQATFAINAEDNVGNASAKDVIYGVDGTGPAIDNVALKGDSISGKWIKLNAVAYATAAMEDGESGFKSASLNGTEFADGQALLNTTAESEITSYDIVAEDNVGNTSKATVAYGVDGSGPEIGAVTLSGTDIYDNWIKLGTTAYAVTDINDAKSGLDTATLQSAAYADGKFLLNTAAETAIVSYDITATDKVGNVNTATVQYGVDGTGPAIGDAVISGDNVYANWIKQGTAATATVQLTDAKSGVKSAVLNGVTSASGVFAIDTANKAAYAAHTLTATDNVGNASTKDVFYGVDGTGPAIGEVTLTGNNISGQWVKQNAVVYAAAQITDNESGFKSATLNGANFVEGQARLDTTAESDIASYDIVALDNVGNDSTAKVSYGVDGSGPEIGEITLAGEGVSGEWIRQGTVAHAVTTITDIKSGLATATLEGAQYTEGQFLLDTSNESAVTGYYLTAIDKVGNSTNSTVRFGVDGTGPEIGDIAITGTNVYDNWIKQGTTAVATATITDAKSGVKSASLNGVSSPIGTFAIDTASTAAKAAHTITATDNVGNSSAKDIVYGIDGAGPAIGDITLAGSNVSGQWIRQSSVAYVQTEITDLESGLKTATLNNAAYDNGAFRIDTATATGLVDMTIQATDNVGNTATATVTYGIDGNGPSISDIYITADGSIYGSWIKQGDLAYANMTITDDKSGLKTATLDGAAYDKGQIILDTAYEADVADHVVTAVDKVGNKTTATVSFGVDGSGPDITNIAFRGETYTDEDNVTWFKKGTTARLLANIDDDKSGLASATFNGASYTAGSFAINTFQEETPGTYAIVAYDNLGNETISESIVYGVDGTGPAITVTATPQTELSPYVEISADFTDALSGVATQQYSFDGTNWLDYTTDFAVVQNGMIYFRATDNVGNTSTASYEVTNIDPATPVITISGPTNVLAKSFTLTVTATKNADISYKIDDAAEWTDVLDNQVTVNANGLYSFQAIDAVGSIGTASITIKNIVSEDGKDEIVIDGEDIYIGDGDDIKAETIVIKNGGRLILGEGATLTVDNLYLDNGHVDCTKGTLNVNKLLDAVNDDNSVDGLIHGTSGTVAKFHEDSYISIDKDLFDAIMATWCDTEDNPFVAGGHIEVTPVTGNEFTQDDIVQMQKKARSFDVNFQQDLLYIQKLVFTETTNPLKIGFTNGLGNSGTNSITFKKNSNVELGTDGSTIDFVAGKSTIAVNTNAIVTFNSNIKEITNITVDSGAAVKLNKSDKNKVLKRTYLTLNGNISSPTNRDFNFKIGDTAVVAVNGNIITSKNKNNKLTMGHNSSLTVDNLVNVNTITLNSGLYYKENSTDAYSIEGYTTLTTNSITNEYLKTSIKLGDFSVLTVNGAITTTKGLTNSLSIGKNAVVTVDKLININVLKLSDGKFWKAAPTDTYSQQGYTQLYVGEIEHDYQNSNIVLGKYTILNCGDINLDLKHDFTTNDRNDTIKTGDYSIMAVAAIRMGSGKNSITIGTKAQFTADSITTGKNTDTFTVKDYATATVNGTVALSTDLTTDTASTDADAFVLGVHTTVATGDVIMGNGKNTLKVGAYSVFKADSISTGKGADTFTIGDFANVNIRGLVTLNRTNATTQLDSIVIGKSANVVLKVANAANLKKFTIAGYTNAYLNSELIALIGSSKNFTVKDNTTNLYDIGDIATSQAFTSIAEETADDSFDKALALEDDTYTGWLCGEHDLDLCDFIQKGDAESITWASSNGALVLTQFDANGNELARTTEDGTVAFMAEAETFSIAFADGYKAHKALAYSITLA